MKMFLRSSCYVLLLFLILISGCKKEQQITALPRSVPEAEGVSSQGLIDFLDALAKSKQEFHSIMLVRHGKVVAEGWWNPYKPEYKHTLYSTSKSFTATALGFAVTEKKLTVNDKVISFFPEDLPDTVSPYLANLKIKDLLSMSAGMDPDPTFKVATSDNWKKAFLATPVLNDPGSKFLYNSVATYMLSAIIQKVTGEKVLDYLKPRLFGPLSIEGMDWETDPQGINCGGWGLRLKTEDMAKFGQLFLQKGKWNGKEVLPASWIEEASTLKIYQNPDAAQSKKDSSDWLQGYCYQMWRCRHNCFRADGAYGQFIIVMPEQDAVLAVTAELGDMQNEINLIWDYLLPALKNDKLPENTAAATELKHRLSSLSLPLPEVKAVPALPTQISGKTFTFDPNAKNLKSMSLQFKDNVCQLSMKIDSASYDFSLGSGSWVSGSTAMIGPSLFVQAKGHYAGFPPDKVMGSYGWKDESTLELVLRYIETPHTETITCRFKGSKISLDFQYSNMPGFKQPEIPGKLQ
jgi:CubicO group peptidase (beta-lactamase class C family)